MFQKEIELHDRLAGLLNKLADRRTVDDDAADREYFSGGELSLVAEGHVAGLVIERIPITPDEYKEIRDVLFIFSLPVRHGRFINNRDEALAGLIVRDTLPEGSPFVIIASGLPGFDAFAAVSHAALRELESIEYEVTSSPKISFDRLLLSWATDVLDMEANPTRAPDAWNARKVSDLTYSLSRRDTIERLLPALSEPLRSAVDTWLAEYDHIYTSFTVDNTDRWIAWKGRRVRDGLNWWWYRIPPSGPVAEEYRSYMAGFEEWRRKRDAETSAQEEEPANLSSTTAAESSAKEND
ncbi:hypothetical protein ACIA8C_26675 [Nocardia sp. NPDC051321]|uniref:hypothetical protein n=1 Tax=Nocardia sp. NPDC051321 TaxID=3364323 RepID=UPI0037A1A457